VHCSFQMADKGPGSQRDLSFCADAGRGGEMAGGAHDARARIIGCLVKCKRQGTQAGGLTAG